MAIKYETHGKCLVTLLALRGQQDRVYHFSKTIGEEHSWALRDYFQRKILRSGRSALKASQIEEMATYSHEAAYRAVTDRSAWESESRLAFAKGFPGKQLDAASENNGSLGEWKRMNTDCS